MNRSYHILWAEVAESDLREIIAYIAIDSLSNALKILGRIKKRAAGLCRFPERGRIVPELQEQGIPIYREVVETPWRILYRISANDVYILSVLDSRRNIEDILLKRLLYQK
jgi:toxin ParE1/3/4